MRNNMLRRAAAVIMALIVMILPVTAMAGENGYGQLTISDLKVNIQGTELDFSGIELMIAGGLDSDAQSMTVGVRGKVDETTATALLEVAPDALYGLIGNRVVTLPYEFLFQQGGMQIDYDQFKGYMDQFWQAIGNAGNYDYEQLAAQYTEMAKQLAEEIYGPFIELADQKLKAAEGELVTVSIDGIEHEAAYTTVVFTNEEIKQYLLQPIAQSYQTGTYAKLYDEMFASMEKLINTLSSANVDMDVDMDELKAGFDMVKQIYPLLTEIDFPEGIVCGITVAFPEGNDVYCDTTIDMSMDMYNFVLKTMTTLNDMPEKAAERQLEAQRELLNMSAKIDVAMNVTVEDVTQFDIRMLNESTDVKNVTENVEFYMGNFTTPIVTASEVATFNNNIIATMTLDMEIDPAGAGTEGQQAVALSINIDNTFDATHYGTFTLDGVAYMGEQNLGGCQLNVEQNAEGGYVKLDVSQNGASSNVLYCGYTNKTETAREVTLFIYPMLSASVTLDYQSNDYTENMMLHNAGNAFDLSTATQEELQEFGAYAQGEFTKFMGAAMSIPGFAAIMSQMQ